MPCKRLLQMFAFTITVFSSQWAWALVYAPYTCDLVDGGGDFPSNQLEMSIDKFSKEVSLLIRNIEPEIAENWGWSDQDSTTADIDILTQPVPFSDEKANSITFLTDVVTEFAISPTEGAIYKTADISIAAEFRDQPNGSQFMFLTWDTDADESFVGFFKCKTSKQ